MFIQFTAALSLSLSYGFELQEFSFQVLTILVPVTSPIKDGINTGTLVYLLSNLKIQTFDHLDE